MKEWRIEGKKIGSHEKGIPNVEGMVPRRQLHGTMRDAHLTKDERCAERRIERSENILREAVAPPHCWTMVSSGEKQKGGKGTRKTSGKEACDVSAFC